jgi:hypothetical protein
MHTIKKIIIINKVRKSEHSITHVSLGYKIMIKIKNK